MSSQTSNAKKNHQNKYSQMMMEQLFKTADVQSIKDQKARQRYFETKAHREEFQDYCKQRLAARDEKTKNKLDNVMSQANMCLHDQQKQDLQNSTRIMSLIKDKNEKEKRSLRRALIRMRRQQ